MADDSAAAAAAAEAETKAVVEAEEGKGGAPADGGEAPAAAAPTAESGAGEGKVDAGDMPSGAGAGVGAGAGAGPPVEAPSGAMDDAGAGGGMAMAGEPAIQVTFNVTSGGYTHVIAFPAHATIGQIKKTLHADLRLVEEFLVLRRSGVVVRNSDTLTDLGFAPGQLDAVIDVSVDPTQTGGEYRMPDSIFVEVFDEARGETVRIPVAIIREDNRKQYLGGYRNKKTGLVYHHASTQTTFERANKWDNMPERFTRETQTVDVVTRSQQTVRETATQMKRRDLYIDESKDRVVYPKDYFTSEALAALREEKTLFLQCQWRGYCARKLAWQLREEAAEKAEAMYQEEERKRAEADAKHNAEIQRRMHPRSREDFEILYNELENWRQHETKRIEESGLPEIERLEALAQLLHKQTKLLQTIDRLKITANKENRSRRIKRMLELMAEPKKWELHDGDVAQVHTPFSTRAKELMELYNGLNLPLLTIDERLDVLLHVKWTVKEFDCLLTRDIVDLIDREADLLNRGRSEKSLEGLRKRISNLFLQFVETPEFNPEATRFQKVPRSLDTRPQVKPIINERAGVTMA